MDKELNEILRRADRLRLVEWDESHKRKEKLGKERLNEAIPLGHPAGYPSEEAIRTSLASLKKRDAESLLDRMRDQEKGKPISIRRQPEVDETMDEMHGNDPHPEHWETCPQCGCEDNSQLECPNCGYKDSDMDEAIEEGAAHYEDLYNKFLAEEADEDEDKDDADDKDADDDKDDKDDAEADGAKKSNGHKADCECPLCKNLKEATDEHNINAPKHHKTGTPLETDAGKNKANKNKAHMSRDGGKRALKPTAKAKAVLAKGTVSESKLKEFAKSEEGEDAAASKHMSQDEMSQLRWMLNLLGRNKEYSYARRVYEKARSGQAITVPQEKKVLHEMIELFMRADKGALRIFLNRLK